MLAAEHPAHWLPLSNRERFGSVSVCAHACALLNTLKWFCKALWGNYYFPHTDSQLKGAIDHAFTMDTVKDFQFSSPTKYDM